MPHCVCAVADCFWTRSNGREVKHITQMCHNLGRDWPLLRASVNPRKESGASFDEEMALLPAISSLSHQGDVSCFVFFPPSSCHYRGRCQYLGLASLLAVQTQSGFGNSPGWTRKCRSRRGWSPSEERKGEEGGPSGHFFFFLSLFSSSRLESLLLRCHITL